MSVTSEPPVLNGRRVRVRAWARGDALSQELWPPYTDPFHSLWNLVRSNGYYEYGRSAQRYVWAVDDRSGRLIGRISLREVDDERRIARLGISMGEPYVGLGLGTEALSIFFDHYFGPLNFAVLLLDVAACNVRAVRCYERLGFSYVESDWRSAGNDPALNLLNDPRFSHLLPHFRRGRFESFVEFYEMRLERADWQYRKRA
jgi:diamine N-acetyltransferase